MEKMNLKGIGIATAVITLWLVSLVLLLSSEIPAHHPLFVFPAILWQSFLYTGLFITAHDAMHGTIVRGHPRINNLIATGFDLQPLCGPAADERVAAISAGL